MSKKTGKSIIPRKTGMTHGIRAFIDSGKLPSGRAYRRAMKEVSLERDRLVAKYGGEKIEPDVLMMVDSSAKAAMVQELCLLYIKKYGILRRDSLNQGNLELHSVLARSFASYANLTRLSLEAAARLADRKTRESEPDILTYIKTFDAEKEAQEAKAGAEQAVAASADGPECPGKGTDEDESGVSRGEDKKQRARMPVEARTPESEGQGQDSETGEKGKS
jgi:hypothetical protein